MRSVVTTTKIPQTATIAAAIADATSKRFFWTRCRKVTDRSSTILRKMDLEVTKTLSKPIAQCTVQTQRQRQFFLIASADVVSVGGGLPASFVLVKARTLGLSAREKLDWGHAWREG